MPRPTLCEHCQVQRWDLCALRKKYGKADCSFAIEMYDSGRADAAPDIEAARREGRAEANALLERLFKAVPKCFQSYGDSPEQQTLTNAMNDVHRYIVASKNEEEPPRLTPEIIEERLRQGAKNAQALHEQLERTRYLRPGQAGFVLRSAAAPALPAKPDTGDEARRLLAELCDAALEDASARIARVDEPPSGRLTLALAASGAFLSTPPSAPPADDARHTESVCEYIEDCIIGQDALDAEDVSMLREAIRLLSRGTQPSAPPSAAGKPR